jgi:urate oxidase
VEADNSKILPTDTMKNMVYSLARKSAAECMEEFAKELIESLLSRNPQGSAAEVSIAEKAWEHLQSGYVAFDDSLRRAKT